MQSRNRRLAPGHFTVFPLTAAKEAQLSPSEAWVLMWLWFRRNNQGIAWPSIARIMEDTGIGRRQVFTILKRLEQTGFIARSGRTGYGGTNVYDILIPEGCPSIVTKGDGSPGVQTSVPTVQSTAPLTVQPTAPRTKAIEPKKSKGCRITSTPEDYR